jgi:hypothetical protein
MNTPVTVALQRLVGARERFDADQRIGGCAGMGTCGTTGINPTGGRCSGSKLRSSKNAKPDVVVQDRSRAMIPSKAPPVRRNRLRQPNRRGFAQPSLR